MRKATNSCLVSVFQQEEQNIIPEQEFTYVGDGEYLLHCVVWPRPAAYADVVDANKSYVNTHFGTHTVIIFDGYPDYPTTKGEAHMLRYRKHVPEVQCNEHIYVTIRSLISYLILKIRRLL